MESKEGMPPEGCSVEKYDIVPVDSCQGWDTTYVDACVFCDRRFGEWRKANEENLATTPAKPGILEMAIKYDNKLEIAKIILDTRNIQKVVHENVDHIKQIIKTDKKYKYKCPGIVCRWVTYKKDKEREVAILCAHWHNYGVLPPLQKDWPGLDILQKTDYLTFSVELQKWCYSTKTNFCKTPMEIEVVKSCTWTQCEICDTYFTQWKKLDSVIANDKAPDVIGIYMVAISCERQIKIFEIFCLPSVFTSIKFNLEGIYKFRQHVLTENEYADKNAFFLVRWMELENVRSDIACFLYAHWLNAEPIPLYRDLKGKEAVERNRHFIFRTNDKKWCYKIDTFKQARTNKCKYQKFILNELEEDVLYVDCSNN
ncbi:uncharacterized protein LOC129971551 isoform X2 [Argiope bruennichi]|uniref:uncharacterized protein LOC129971551 isoform X2 n=1 Tax=Argiope bruennichi TaxID=94029 RepID=UPI002494FE65|nr:uncharacterized protein LOC129971551 isoform X2 [Argiope bruennichi]